MFREHVPEAKMFPRLISNSGKRKNQFANLLVFLKILAVFFLDFVRTEWAELAVSTYNGELCKDIK